MGNYAITPNGVGNPVGYRRSEALATGETFLWPVSPEGLVLAEDSVSLRAPTVAEDTISLVEQRNRVLKVIYLNVLHGGFDFDGNRFESDLRSMTFVTGTVGIINSGLPVDPINWVAVDGTSIAIADNAQFLQLADALYKHSTATHARYQVLKAALANSSDPANTPNLLSGWPSTTVDLSVEPTV